MLLIIDYFGKGANMTAETKIEFDRDRALEYDLDIRKAILGYDSADTVVHHNNLVMKDSF